jgi:hypothetical protein
MPSPATVSPQPSFAGFLASIALPDQKFPPQPETDWGDDGLADDIAHLSYEGALKGHAKHWGVATSPHGESSAADASLADDQAPSATARQISQSDQEAGASAIPDATGTFINIAGVAPPAQRPGRLKSVRVTIRMDVAEYARIRNRAAEAGMAVSAYLRACASEADSLRAQVKEALATLRCESESRPKGQPLSQVPLEPASTPSRPARRWFAHLWRRDRCPARA